MAIEINSFFNEICHSFYSSIGLNRILLNVVYSSALLAGLVLLIILCIYPCKKNTPIWLIFKLYLYVGLAILGVFSLHDHFIKTIYRSQMKDDNLNKMMQNIHGGGVYMDDKIKVAPQIPEDGEQQPQLEPELESNSSVSEMIADLERRI